MDELRWNLLDWLCLAFLASGISFVIIVLAIPGLHLWSAAALPLVFFGWRGLTCLLKRQRARKPAKDHSS